MSISDNIFDIAIIGSGVSGAFATYKIAKEYKNVTAVVFDIGRPPAKRKAQITGYFGGFPSSDGKLYQSNINDVATLIGSKKAKSYNSKINTLLNNVGDFNITQSRTISPSLEKKIKKAEYDYILNDYIQIYPKDIHALSKYMAGYVENCKNITYSFDNEVLSIIKQKNMFLIQTEDGEFKCKKLLISVGRSGWRWAHELYKNFGIIENNDYSRFGIRIEMEAQFLKDFNKSCCTLIRDKLEIGPMSWFGTVIPEDHEDLVISAFRSNENRWQTDKVSFSLIGNIPTENMGVEQTDRIGKLTFILANDRVIKEKVSTILSKKSKISVIPEYNWLIKEINDLSKIMPDILNKAYFHAPTILPITSKINIGTDLSTEVEGMFVAGESAGITGILSAMIMGQAAVDGMLK